MRIILIIIALLIILTGCSQPILQADTVPITTNQVENTVPDTVTVTSIVEVENTDKINELQLELDKYKLLINNLNKLLKNVYYVYQEKSDGSWTGGTGFSIKYNDKFYLLTAGHIVDGQYGIFKNLGFNANFSDKYIYPKLLSYNNDYLNRNDYAIFYSDKIIDGLKIDTENDNPEYILGYGNINTIKEIYYTNIDGESGSPIIDIEEEVVGISTVTDGFYNTNINVILQAIGNIK